MSKIKISKARLEGIIKEEFEHVLNENRLTKEQSVSSIKSSFETLKSLTNKLLKTVKTDSDLTEVNILVDMVEDINEYLSQVLEMRE